LWLGEFQKRIKETGILNEKYGLISSILDVVEEAKTEFPETEKSIKRLHAYYKKRLEKGDKLNKTAQMIEWFERWFS